MKKNHFFVKNFMEKRRISLRFNYLAVFGLTLLFVVACANQVGDPCTTDASCGQGRRCDLSSKDGYCTIMPCNENTCPKSESICVVFENEASACMSLCDSADDCRDGYYCDTTTASKGFCRNKP